MNAVLFSLSIVLLENILEKKEKSHVQLTVPVQGSGEVTVARAWESWPHPHSFLREEGVNWGVHVTAQCDCSALMQSSMPCVTILDGLIVVIP